MRGAAGDPGLRPAALAQIELLQSTTINRVAEGYVDGRRRGDLPRHRQPDGELDVDRRPDRASPGR